MRVAVFHLAISFRKYPIAFSQIWRG